MKVFILALYPGEDDLPPQQIKKVVGGRLVSMRDSLFLFPLTLLFCIALVLWSMGLVMHVPMWMFVVAFIAQCCVFGFFFVSHITTLRSLMRIQMHRIILCALALVLVSHAVGILLPEVGFDALWYHLPITRSFVWTGSIRVIPSLYQSSQPILGDVLFAPWFAVSGTTAVKVCAFLIMCLYFVGVAHLARKFLSVRDTLLTVLLIATFHTIAWQATSAYVDIFTACFGIGALLVLLRERRGKFDAVLSGLFIGGMLLTKAVALLFISPYLLFLFSTRRSVVVSVFMSAVLFFSLQLMGLTMTHTIPVISIFARTSNDLIIHDGGIRTLLQFGIERMAYVLTLPVQLSFHRESYLSVLFLVALPFVVRRIQERRVLTTRVRSAWVFVVLSLMVWSVVVPVSVRYGLASITLCTILLVSVLAKTYWGRRVFLAIVVFTVITNTGVRMIVHARALPYLLGNETTAQYLRRFDQGILKGPLESWYTNVQW